MDRHSQPHKTNAPGIHPGGSTISQSKGSESERVNPPLSPPASADKADLWSGTVVPDLAGTTRLVLDAVEGLTDTVEAIHSNIYGLAPLIGASRAGRTKGITGLVYRNIRRVSSLVGSGLDIARRSAPPLLPGQQSSFRREVALATVNGIVGDHLASSGNPLAIPMQFRSAGKALVLDRPALAETFPEASKRLLVLVHGLCMSDLQWRRNGHDHGEALSRELGYTPVYLRYNSGQPIGLNGREFADLLEELVREWPVPVEELIILGHSMGGLVARSACLQGDQAGHDWPRRLKKMVFLGTPHHGAPLERMGEGLVSFLGVSPYSEPIGRLGRIRSAGIQDLRQGNILGATPTGSFDGHTAESVPLPKNARCFTLAATIRSAPVVDELPRRGDGLVPVMSALGQHKIAERSLPIPASHQATLYGKNHFDLLGLEGAYDQVLRWLND